jgi:hypothetical protein
MRRPFDILLSYHLGSGRIPRVGAYDQPVGKGLSIPQNSRGYTDELVHPGEFKAVYKGRIPDPSVEGFSIERTVKPE